MEPPDTPPELPPRMPSRPSSLIFPKYNPQEKRVVTPPVENIIPKVSPKKHKYRFNNKQIKSATGRVKGFAKSGMSIGEKFTFWIFNKLSAWSHQWFAHCFLTVILILYTVGGALMFIAIEGRSKNATEETVSKVAIVEDIQKARFNLMQELQNYSGIILHNTSKTEWHVSVGRKLEDYESFIAEAYLNISLISTSPDLWTFFNTIVYCGTVYSTIGYGHMFPKTFVGMVLTIVYAIIGIPLFLISLTDFGKLFTRGMKFLWTFVRRLYYTGSCRKVRKKAHVQEIIQSAQLVYGLALVGKRAIFSENENTENDENPKSSKSDDTTKKTKSNFEVDDEFNLPISVAICVLLLYIFLGALMYSIWEQWNFFDSFYFVFISLSTIGFGDFVPKSPFCMIASVAYLVFGLALMSMCINVVQVELTDKFSRASEKFKGAIAKEEKNACAELAVDELEAGKFTIIGESAEENNKHEVPTVPNIEDKLSPEEN